MLLRKKIIICIGLFASTSLIIHSYVTKQSKYQLEPIDLFEHRQKGKHSESTKLCVLVTIFNPASFTSRYELYKRFEKHMATFDVHLITVELAFFDKEFEVTQPDNPYHIQLRTDDVFWYKENLLNIGLKKSPKECKYIAWIDSEIEFLNKNWVRDAVEALKKYKVVQLFDAVRILGPNSEILTVNVGYVRCKNVVFDRLYSPVTFLKAMFAALNLTWTNPRLYCATGYAWAARKQTLLDIGGFFDKAIVGSGDLIMSGGFQGEIEGKNSPFAGKFLKEIKKWQKNAADVIDSSIGYLNNSINHLWHGDKKDRSYHERKIILASSLFQYDPNSHLFYDNDGLLHFDAMAKKFFFNSIMNYFLSRKEDLYAMKTTLNRNKNNSIFFQIV